MPMHQQGAGMKMAALNLVVGLVCGIAAYITGDPFAWLLAVCNLGGAAYRAFAFRRC